MNQFQIIALSAMLLFYTAYFTKQLLQHKRGIQTDQLGKGNKPAKERFIEFFLKIMNFIIVPVDICIILIYPNVPYPAVFRYAGLLAAVLGTAVFILAMATMRDNWRAGIPEEGRTQMVTKGIYRISRNPAFLGFDLLYLGILTAFPNPLCLLFTAAAVLSLHLQILAEEKFLTKAFGRDYIMYKQKTGRYLPGILTYLLLGLAVAAIGTALGYYQITPMKAPKDFKEEYLTVGEVMGKPVDFSMTMNHVREMAAEPHATGSKEIETVRGYLVKQFEQMGCDYRTQEFQVDMKDQIKKQVESFQSYIREHPEEKAYYEDYFAGLGFASYEEKYRADIYCSNTDYINGVNYLVKADAPDTDKGVLFVSHYDSTKNGPGAADDLISVASMLEALRSIQSKGTSANDLYFLFTDAEELELFGADAFVRDFPDMKEKIELVVNLEARGNQGTLLMFETSPHDKGIVKALNRAVDQTSAFSFLAAIYKMMPNDTDLSEFLEAGYSGMNFAVIGGPENYHQMTDSYENLDRDSAYMYLKTAADLTEYFSTAPLDTLKSDEDAVYFPFMKGNTVIISNHGMLIFSCFIGIIALIWIGILIFKKAVKIKDFIITLAIMLASIATAAILGISAAFICDIISSRIGWFESVGIINNIFYSLCFAVTIEVLLLIYAAAKRAGSKQAPVVCGILLFDILNWICMYLLNSLAYLFTIPLCILLLYSIYQYFNNGNAKSNCFRLCALLIADPAILMLYTPVIYLLYMGLLSSLLFAGMILASLAILPAAVIAAPCFTRKAEV